MSSRSTDTTMQQVHYNSVSAENGTVQIGETSSNTLQGRVCKISLKNVIIIVIVSTIALLSIIFNIVQAVNHLKTKTPFDDWLKYKGMDYYFSEERLNWTSSRDFCLQHGAQLAVLKDKQIKATNTGNDETERMDKKMNV
ncbi:uncharacterized protein O3C94_022630 [Discoglossus pictus]